MRKVRLYHETLYDFPNNVTLGPHRLILRPREGHNLHIESSKLQIEPTADLRWHSDALDNSIAVATFGTMVNQLKIVSEVVVQLYDVAPFNFVVANYAVDFPFSYAPAEIAILSPFLDSASDTSGAVLNWLGSIWSPGESIQTFELLTRLNLRMRADFAYQVREAEGVQSPDETISKRMGSCRDFANLFMHGARSLGLAARFVSGYLNAPGSNGSSAATHAWSEVYIPGAGWKGFDPTIGELVGSNHIPVAVARLAEDVPPVSGSFFGPTGTSLRIYVDVREID
jgi:transglutaminase-like putative cysteine protease